MFISKYRCVRCVSCLARLATPSSKTIEIQGFPAPPLRFVPDTATNLLAWYRVVILVLPFRVIATRLEKSSHRPVAPETSQEKELPRRVGRAIGSIAAHTPWESKCLIQSLTAYRMLKHRHFPCTLSLGVAKDERGKMVAHAWTQSESVDVTGTEIKDRYTVTYRFE